ncbi:CHASE2 domain-containing protein [Mastigocoleus testarum]|uniref:CHASE2 domain-containing protein n=1 Tax=Mastigocoleus testarum BC008 TaxID=371196 RepID=A0A0V7ZDE4_9CYAN|nr:CHASE2 domain-containing protein [Mastigocoleus testarum]KST62542.1 hypothetical protein BC008_10245 [Mastigocoleus testarum BC008]KST62580.1 hypothetical protein BC008_10440 [Mastigocoleus testarum BC008]
MDLSGGERKQLQEVLMNAFPNRGSLKQMLSFHLNKNLHEIASEANLSQVVFELIEKAESENWLEDLVLAARKANPANERLKYLAKSLGIPLSSEKEIFASNSSQETAQAPPNTTVEIDINKPASPSPKGRLTRFVERIRQPVFSGSGFRTLLLVSLMIAGGLVVLRFFGLMEWLELKTFDHLIQIRPLNEGVDSRLLIIEITDEDIKAQDKRQEQGQGFALKDASLNRLLETLEKYNPRLIGLDVYRPYNADPNLPGLLKRLGKPNVFAVCKVPDIDHQGKQIGHTSVDPPKEVAKERVGFSDFVTDRDGIVRRYLMVVEGISGSNCQAKQSFSFLLARRYLELELRENSNYQDPFKSGDNLQLGGITFPQLQPFTVGYQDVDASGFQILLNYRATGSGVENIAKRKTLEDILNNRFDEQDVRDKIVLIGGTATQGINDNWSTPYGTIPGVVVNGHMISQILSAVLDEVPLLQVWSQPIEILWIWGWSFFGGVFALYSPSLRDLGIATGCGILVLYMTSIISLTVASIWIPLIPPVLAFVSTGNIYFVFLDRN